MISQPAAHIDEVCERLGGVPFTAQDVFRNASPRGIASALDEFCLASLGSGVERSEFFYASAGSVHGLVLTDGRRVVVKVHRPSASSAYLRAVQTVQRRLASDGFPCPEPLVGPTRLGRGIAVCESLLDRGTPPDGHNPAVRRAMAGALARVVWRLRPFTSLEDLRRGPMVVGEGRLWPTPHDGRLDFAATSVGAEWIDALAARARAIQAGAPAGDWVVGHTDWRVQNMRFAAGTLSAVYDWDSLGIEREPVVVGLVARGFTADWSASDRRQLPTLEEALGFVRDYEAARGEHFDPEEHRVLRAALTYRMAYSARCEHSDLLTDFGRRAPVPARAQQVPAGSARAFLAAHAAELLGVT